MNTLLSCKLFTRFPIDQIKEIEAISTLKKLSKGDHLFREGDPAEGFYIMQTGAINVHRVGTNGRIQVIQVFRAGDSFAEAALTTKQGYPADAQALESSQVLLIHQEGFLNLVKRQPELALCIIGSLSHHVQSLVGLLEDFTQKNVEVRLANWLVKQCPDATSEDPVHIELPTTKRRLAEELGTISETFSRTLAKLRAQNLLTVDGRSVCVTSPARLSKLADNSPSW